MAARYTPVVFDWLEVEVFDREDGSVVRKWAMVPQDRYHNICGRQFHEAESYPLAPIEARSRASHSQYFAAVADGFSNLPEDLVALADRLGTKTIPPHGWVDTEHLRKWCLCETNWCDVYEFDFDTKAEAMRLAKFYRDKDDYAQINVRGTHVTIKTAKSQSAQAMSKEPFEASKRDVLDLIEVMVGVKRGSLMKEARPRRRA